MDRLKSSHMELIIDTLNHIYIRTGAAIVWTDPTSSRKDMGVAIREQLKRNEKIQKMIAAFHAPPGYIGVYIQNSMESLGLYSSEYILDSERTAMVDAATQSTVEIFVTEMQRIITVDPAVVFYVSADSADVVKQVCAQFEPSRTTHLDPRGDCYTPDKECGEFALVDMMLLGNSKKILSSGNDNAVADVAAIKAGKMPAVVGVDFPTGDSREAIRDRLLGIDL
jgi:hypothetical protein